MLTYILKRALMALTSIILVTFLTFSLLSLMPGDTATVIVQRIFVGDVEYIPSNSEVENVRTMYGLSDPLYLQYFLWLGNALRKDFGLSYLTGMPVKDEILPRFMTTLTLAIASGVLAFLFSIAAGLYSASRRGRIQDRALTLLSSFFVSVPNFFLALVLIMFFSLRMDIFPVSGWDSIAHMVLPVLTLALGTTAVTTRVVRASALDVMGKAYITTARAKGLKESHVLRCHVLKNALIPVIPYMGLQMGYLLSGTVIVETIFAIPGMGKLLVDSIEARDVMVIQACVAVIALMYSSTNIIADMITRILDPRISFEGEQ